MVHNFNFKFKIDIIDIYSIHTPYTYVKAHTEDVYCSKIAFSHAVCSSPIGLEVIA